MKKYTKQELENKKLFHERRLEFYSKKLEEVEKQNKIGFKWYNN